MWIYSFVLVSKGDYFKYELVLEFGSEVYILENWILLEVRRNVV